MERKVRATKAEKILVGVTAVFLCALLILWLQARRTMLPGDGTDYTVQTQVDASVPVPEAVDVNTATVEELATLPGIGEKLARRIVDYREANGPFATVDGLTEVSGIGEAKLEALRNYARAG